MAYTDQTSTTEFGVDSSPSLLSFTSGSEKPFKTNAEDKFRVRLAAEGYDENGTMKYREYSTDDTDDDNNRNTKGRKGRRRSSNRCDRIASPTLIALAVCLLVVVGFVLIAVLLKVQLDKTSTQCQSPECITTSSTMLSKMDAAASPCVDFYQYACSAFTTDVMIPPDRVVWSTFNVMGQRNMAVMRQLLESDGVAYKGLNSSAVQKAKQFYSACVNLSTPEAQGSLPMLRLIKEIGSWSLTSDPVSGSWSESSWSLETALSVVHSFGVSPLFVIDVAPDDKNSSVNIIQIDQAGLSLPDYQSYIGNDSTLFHDVYVQYFTDVVQLLRGGGGGGGGGAGGGGGGEGKDASISQRIEKVWQFEKALARAFLKPNERADVQAVYNIRSISEVQKQFGSKFNFSDYLRLSFNKPVPTTEKILVRVPVYFYRLGAILGHSTRETVADYIGWLMIQKMVPYMSTSFQLAQLKLKSAVYKVSSIAPRWESCVYRTTDLLGFATGALYINRYFDEKDKQNVEDLYRRIVEAFRSRIPKADWMDAETKARALDKVNALGHKIGYPDFLLDPAKLDQFYSKLTLTDMAFENILKAEKFAYDQINERLGKVPDRNEWLMTPAEVNAYYDPSRNQIVLPAGILQQPFTHRSFPKSLSFGALGFIIGHELTHGFDNSGRQFDKYGNMADWWGNASAKEFERRSECLVNEYNAFKVYDENLDGVSTLGENIADNGGIKISLQAYNDWMKTHDGDDWLLPGLNMTSLQQFFLSYAQVWCTYYTRQYAIQLIATDLHSNGKYRVNGVLQNVPEFSKAFGCPSGSPMNPETKCSLW